MTTSLHSPSGAAGPDAPRQPDAPYYVASAAAGGDRQEAAGPVTRLVPVATVLLVMAGLTWQASRPLANPDTWFHLRIGEQLLGPWSLHRTGPLSSFGDVPWVPTQWSTEMLAAAFERWFGLPGVAWLFGAIFVALVLAVHAVARREGAPLPAAVATGACVLAVTSALSARPQVVTLVLLAVVAGGWLAASRGGRPPYHLVPLTWVWATAHGMWSVGVVVSAVCCVGLLLDRRAEGALDRETVLRALSVPVLSLAAASVTPLGPQLLRGQLAVGRRASSIGEWGPTSFRHPDAFVLALMVGAVVVCWARRGGVRWMPLLLLLLAVGWAMLVSRMVPCAAVLVAPLLAGALDRELSLRPGAWAAPGRLPRGERRVLLAGAALLLVGLAVVVPSTAQRPADVPTAFGSRLAALPEGSPVLVQDGTGAWMEWRYPGLSPVVDGMLDAYPLDYIARYTGFVRLEPGWRRFLTDSRAEQAVLLERSPLTAAVQQLGWRVVQHTGRWVYLVAPAEWPGTGLAKTD